MSKVLLLYGGFSAEREVSISSITAYTVIGVKMANYKVFLICSKFPTLIPA